MNNHLPQYAVVSTNSTKVGSYYFKAFVKGVPTFEPNHCLSAYKTYKRKADAERTKRRVESYYRMNTCITTTIITINA